MKYEDWFVNSKKSFRKRTRWTAGMPKNSIWWYVSLRNATVQEGRTYSLQCGGRWAWLALFLHKG